jgi:acetyl esterase/lipase
MNQSAAQFSRKVVLLLGLALLGWLLRPNHSCGQTPDAPKRQKAAGKKKGEPQPLHAALGVRIENEVAYSGPGRSEKLDIYIPTGAKTGAHFPCVIAIHGGGFMSGDKSDVREQRICNAIAQRGYVAVSVNYFLPERDQLSGFPQNIHDCKTAIRFLRRNADQYQIDPAHFAAIGGSAGGYFAAMLLLTTDGDALDPRGPYGEVSCQIQAAVDMYGPVDLAADPSSVKGTVVEKFLTRVQSTWPRERLELYSPAHHVRAGMPPLLITHGARDPSIAISQSERFVELLKKAGATYYYFPLPEARHSFDLESSGMDLTDTVIAFLDRHLKGRKVEIPQPKKVLGNNRPEVRSEPAGAPGSATKIR